MSELAGIVADAPWLALLVVPVVLGMAPGFVVRTAVRLYPKEHPRRRELVAELYVIASRWERLIWAFEQVEVAISEGLSERLRKHRVSQDAGLPQLVIMGERTSGERDLRWFVDMPDGGRFVPVSAELEHMLESPHAKGSSRAVDRAIYAEMRRVERRAKAYPRSVNRPERHQVAIARKHRGGLMLWGHEDEPEDRA
ncbi:hypothetical protein GCM10027053_47470 [Intrasporangium mesophilum]